MTRKSRTTFSYNILKVYAAFTHAGLTTSYQRKSLYKSVHVVKITRYIVSEEDWKSD